MKTKQFFLYSIVYIAIVAILVFTQQSSSYTLGLFGLRLRFLLQCGSYCR